MLKLDPITTLAIASLLYLIGVYIVNHISILKRLCIPAPVIGGLLFSILVAILQSTHVLTIKLDSEFIQNFFMLAFFTTIGLGASLKLLRLGGKILIIYFFFCGILAVFQNIIGISLAKVLNIPPLLGLTAGSMSMEGGHGNAAAYGQTIHDMGFESALTAALAAATLGLVAGGLIGGPIVKLLITKYNLKPKHTEEPTVDYGNVKSNKYLQKHMNPTTIFFLQFTIITVCMAVGSYLGNTFSHLTGINIPIYVGAMFVAVIIRNISEYGKLSIIDMQFVDKISDISLSLFLSIALMSIQLTEIYQLALPLIIIVLIQVIFIILFSILIVFRALGKDYDAAVMIGGFIGHGLGATPNAMANLDVITKKFGPSPKSYLVVPIVGAFLIDLIGVPIVTTFINLF
ncbi:sodium/glutamate symporter [Staphylococcus gallinarum]|uniref:Sodium/glutamate symporter n=2 Tax=Staphylococcus gallinarum TaxID=1293 RepID=A0A0D0ST15_STAGA|nr:sodium/glutamate symporter [Staphylococcus gallinarum]KIR12229.1 sodium:glutamate symporter [Staphylococcus gallinarum]GEQ06641.1 sodium/glutamate symporter [Staphylococcus gallinarum]SUQ38562.1 sodium glutamate symporter [Staphylococcus gallinarum]